MLLRIAGTLLVMVGCAGFGFYFSAKENFRVQDLQEFKKAFLILASEIEFMRSTLAEACGNIAKRTSSEVSGIFAKFSQLLSEGEGETAYQLWLTALEAKPTWLAAEDRVVIEDFGKTLGYLDKKMQKNAINCAIAYIDEKTTTLAAQSAKNKRMYQSLGVIGGLLITVVLW